mmetsp:Transcript_22510/g.48879  ORF Transcript_22510/g.48879 Transcript_22510/m.48879 type:complete len:200 (+) Transcript_22510:559-1158(+)
MFHFVARNINSQDFSLDPCVMGSKKRVDTESTAKINDMLSLFNRRKGKRIAYALIIENIAVSNYLLFVGCITKICQNCTGLLHIAWSSGSGADLIIGSNSFLFGGGPISVISRSITIIFVLFIAPVDFVVHIQNISNGLVKATASPLTKHRAANYFTFQYCAFGHFIVFLIFSLVEITFIHHLSTNQELASSFVVVVCR